MKNIFQFIKENETRNEDDVTQEEFLEALLEIEEELDEFELDEATDFKSTFDDLKKGDTVKIKYGSSISKQQEGTFKVTFKSIVGKSKVGKITLVKQGEGAAKVKHYLYDRDGKVSMAMGDMGANMTRLVKESLDEKAPKIDLDKYAAHMNRNKKAVKKTSASQDYIKDVQKRSNKMGEAISMKNSNNQYYYQDPKGVVQAVGSKDAMRKMNVKQAKDGNKGGSFSMNLKKYKVGDQIKESAELNELSAEEKKLINTMYDKKGNLTPMGKKVMDHGKKNAVKESVELDEASEEGKIRVIDLSDAHPDNRMGAKEKSGYQVQRMTKGKFVNQGKPYKKYADAKKVQQGTGQHSMQFEEKSGTGYELYHKDFSGAMGHAYAHAKKKFNITVDSDEIDDKVAMGPRKPGNGKTNTYRLKGDKGNIQVQVYNRGGSKPFELNMYKESVDLDKAVVLDEASLIPQLQTIVKDKQHAKIKGMIVDTFTASMITQIYSKVNDANKAKMDKLPLEKLVNIAHKMMKK
jgi:hypothetical protein|tara:strand:- start:72 stop:1628 length:1557 start_codon:yes stop_codon:yes gene_type:complete